MKIWSLILLGVAASSLMAQTPLEKWFDENVSFKAGPQDCAIDGTVLSSVGDAPIPRARVSAGSKSTIADTAGHWSFDKVTCGATDLSATRPGFVQDTEAAVELNSGFPQRGYQLLLSPQAVVTGTIVDSDGEPFGTGTVTAFISRVVYGRRLMQVAGFGNSNDIGEFRIAGLKPGKYIFCARNNAAAASEKPDTVLGETCYPAPIRVGSGAAMKVSAGAEVHANFEIPRNHGVRVRGTLSGVQQGQDVGLTLTEPGDESDWTQNLPWERVGTDGFQIRGVSPGSHILTGISTDGKSVGFARIHLQVDEEDIDGVSLPFAPGANLSGTVRVESGKPTRWGPVKLNLHLRLYDNPVEGIDELKWNGIHSFELRDVPPVRYMLEAAPPRGLYLKSPLDITVARGMMPIEVVLGDDGGSVQGSVRNCAGVCWAMLLRDGRVWNAKTGPAGNFAIYDVPPGRYAAYAWRRLDDVEYANPDWMGQFSALTVDVEASQAASIQLTLSEME